MENEGQGGGDVDGTEMLRQAFDVAVSGGRLSVGRKVARAFGSLSVPGVDASLEEYDEPALVTQNPMDADLVEEPERKRA